MWNFLARGANWTEIIANTLALGFSLMTIVAIGYAVMFNPGILTAVGSVTSGIAGMILGYYFSRERLRRAQRETRQAITERNVATERAAVSEEELEEMRAIMLYLRDSLPIYDSQDNEIED